MNSNPSVELPFYRRARGYRIYGNGGRRFLDFYQDGGHAILGHRQPRIILEMKNLLSRGQIAAYPTTLNKKTKQAVMTLIPGLYAVHIYRSQETALRAAGLHLGESLSPSDVHDPALPGSFSRIGSRVSLWRPFLESDSAGFPLLIPVLPVSVPPAPAVLAFREKPAAGVPQSEDCSPASLGALKKAIFELLSYAKNCDRSGWASFDSLSSWSRKGPYLTLERDERDFAGMFYDMLEHGILLSPRYPGPSIIPGEYTQGEIAYFRKSFSTG